MSLALLVYQVIRDIAFENPPKLSAFRLAPGLT
jgi:hypothetical protein